MELMHFVQKLKKKISTNNKPESQGKKLEFAAEIREISRCAWFVHLLVVGVSLERQWFIVTMCAAIIQDHRV